METDAQQGAAVTAPDRPAVTEEIQRYKLHDGHDGAWMTDSDTGNWVLYTAHLTACASQSKSRLARYDEAVRLVVELLAIVAAENSGGQHYDAIDKAESFIAAKPKEEKR